MAKPQGMGPFVIPEGLGHFTFFLIGEPPVGKHLGIVRIQLDGLVVIPDGLINNAPLSVDITPVAIGFGKFGVQADRLIEVCNGPTELAFDIKGIGPIVEGRDKI